MKTLLKKDQAGGVTDRRALHLVVPARSDQFGSSGTALLDSKGTIVTTDNGWLTLANKAGLAIDDMRLPVNYFQLCRHARNSPIAWRKSVSGIQSVLKGAAAVFTFDFGSHASSGLNFFRLNAVPLTYHQARIVVTLTEVTDLQLARTRSVRQFAQRLIGAQEAERQRISSELHDDLGNRLGVIALSLRQTVKRCEHDPTALEQELNKTLSGVTELSGALRDLSHSLYPSLLRFGGLLAALKSLRDLVEQTQRIKLDLQLPEEMPRLSADCELCIFRVAQECLHNILKHADAERARLVLEHTADVILLTVLDWGAGFDPSNAGHQGIGLLSMEERALSVGGHIEVNARPGRGTEICLTVPLRPGPLA